VWPEGITEEGYDIFMGNMGDKAMYAGPDNHHLDYSAGYPLYRSSGSFLTLKTAASSNAWSLFDPFDGDLWVASLFAFLATGIIIFGMDSLLASHASLELAAAKAKAKLATDAETRRDGTSTSASGDGDASRPLTLTERNGGGCGGGNGADAGLSGGSLVESARNCAYCVYHALAMLLGGEEYEWQSASSKLLRLGTLFLVLILGSTYTANLAAFFTRPAYVIHGPKTLADLRDAHVCIPYDAWSYSVSPFVKSVVVPPYSESNTMEENGQFCHNLLKERKADAW
jgi:hypothetical protein